MNRDGQSGRLAVPWPKQIVDRWVTHSKGSELTFDVFFIATANASGRAHLAVYPPPANKILFILSFPSKNLP